MAIDIFQSRRGYNELCRWWTRDERDRNELNEIIFNRAPSGIFWAKEENSYSQTDSIAGGKFMFDHSRITIKTPDDVTGLKSEDLVEFEGEIWMVVSVQRVKAKKQNSIYASDENCSHFWYMELRK